MTPKKEVNLSGWYSYVATVIAPKPYCWECGEFISKSDYINASAHIFPKAIFKSISEHPLNFLVLGVRCGCHEKSHRLDTFSKMKVWSIACNRFRSFESQITEKHKYLNSFRELIK